MASFVSSQTNEKIRTVADLLLVLTLLCALLHFGKVVFLPLIVAIYAYMVFRTLFYRFDGYMRGAYWITNLVTICLLMSLSLLMLSPTYTLLLEMLEKADLYNAKLREALNLVATHLENSNGVALDRGALAGYLGEIKFAEHLKSMMIELWNVVAYFGVSALFFVFLVVSRRRTFNPLPSAIESINQEVLRYIVSKVVISVMTGSLVGIVLQTFGLEFAWFIAVCTIILNFIPNIGSIIATMLPIPLALLDMRSMSWLLGVVLVPASIQFVIGNVLEPKFQGDLLRLHPVTILAGLLFWGAIWGPAGMFIAVPIILTIKSVCRQSTDWNWVSDLFEGNLSFMPRKTSGV